MKWYYCILILAAVACSGKVTITEDEIKPDIYYATGSYYPFSGKCVVLFSDTGIVKEQFTYKHGILHGKAIVWYKNGQVRRKGSYSKGQISGKWEFWDENGTRILEAYYKDDMLSGAYVSMYHNGQIKEQGRFEANRRIGNWTSYDEQGRLESPEP